MTDSRLNWKTGTGYPGERTTLRAWAWEFLRRNPDYRTDWALYLEKIAKIREKYKQAPIDDIGAINLAYGQDDPLGAIHDPERLDNETYAEWIDRVGKGKTWPLYGWLARKWGLRRFTDPASCYELFLFADPGITDLTGVTEIHRPVVPMHDELTRILEFDLRRPLAPQLANAQRLLEHRQRDLWHRKILDEPPIERARPDKFANYLRVLDALDQLGVTSGDVTGEVIEDVGSALFPRDENAGSQRNHKVGAMVEPARLLRDRDYRYLPVLKIEKPNKSRKFKNPA
jgi:hypothetical protein